MKPIKLTIYLIVKLKIILVNELAQQVLLRRFLLKIYMKSNVRDHIFILPKLMSLLKSPLNI
jgi:hypothetical protein